MQKYTSSQLYALLIEKGVREEDILKDKCFSFGDKNKIVNAEEHTTINLPGKAYINYRIWDNSPQFDLWKEYKSFGLPNHFEIDDLVTLYKLFSKKAEPKKKFQTTNCQRKSFTKNVEMIYNILQICGRDVEKVYINAGALDKSSAMTNISLANYFAETVQELIQNDRTTTYMNDEGDMIYKVGAVDEQFSPALVFIPKDEEFYYKDEKGEIHLIDLVKMHELAQCIDENNQF